MGAVSTRQDERIAVATCTRACGEQEALEFRAALLEIGSSPRIVIDLSESDTLDGAHLAMLAALQRDAQPGQRIAVCAHPTIFSSLMDWRLDESLRVFGDFEKAVAAVEEGA